MDELEALKDHENRDGTGIDLQAATAAIAAQGLVGAAVELPRGPLSDVTWRHLLSAVRRHGLEGHLLEVIIRGHLRATAQQREQAHQAQADATAGVVLLESDFMCSVDVLTEAGIDYRVFNDWAFAHLAYQNPALRSAADLDLLVPPSDMKRAVEVLSENGAERAQARSRYGLARRVSKAVTFQLPSGELLRLHRTLAQGLFGMRVEPGALFETVTTFEVGDRILRALGLEELLLQACYSAALPDVSPRLLALRDVAELCLGGGIDPVRAERLAARWNALAVLSRGIALAWDTFRIADAVPLSVRASRYRLTRREQWLLGLHTHSPRHRVPAALASLPVISGLRGKLAFLGPVALPARSYVPARARRSSGRGRS